MPIPFFLTMRGLWFGLILTGVSAGILPGRALEGESASSAGPIGPGGRGGASRLHWVCRRGVPLAPLFGQVTGREMTGSHLPQRGDFDGASRFGHGTAWMKRAA